MVRSSRSQADRDCVCEHHATAGAGDGAVLPRKGRCTPEVASRLVTAAKESRRRDGCTAGAVPRGGRGPQRSKVHLSRRRQDAAQCIRAAGEPLGNFREAFFGAGRGRRCAGREHAAGRGSAAPRRCASQGERHRGSGGAADCSPGEDLLDVEKIYTVKVGVVESKSSQNKNTDDEGKIVPRRPGTQGKPVPGAALSAGKDRGRSGAGPSGRRDPRACTGGAPGRVAVRGRVSSPCSSAWAVMRPRTCPAVAVRRLSCPEYRVAGAAPSSRGVFSRGGAAVSSGAGWAVSAASACAGLCRRAGRLDLKHA